MKNLVQASSMYCVLSCIKRGLASRVWEVTVLHYSALGPIRSFASRPGPPVQKKCGAVGVGPEEGHEDDQRATAQGRQAEGTELVQLEEKAPGRSYCTFPVFEASLQAGGGLTFYVVW